MESLDWAAKAYNDGSVFTAFDLETTGLSPSEHQIVEIGAVKFDKRGIIARFSNLINPGSPMSKEASAVNHITDEMLKGKPSLEEVLPDFLHFIHGTILVAHNTPFDCGFINEYLKISLNPPFRALPNPIADTLVFSREIFPGMKSYSLQKFSAELGIPPGNAHRAEDDAWLCMEILIRCIIKAAA